MVVDKYQDDEDLDPAKRMRFTPQPPTVISSSATEDAEITRISDSMPGTATDEQSLQQRLAYAEEAYRNEREARRAGETHFREQEERWDERQTEFENLSRDYRLLLGKQQTVENKLETVTKNNNTLRERLATRTSEMNELSRQLDEQRATDTLSSDAQIVEITKLRKELAEANEAKERALSAAKTAEASEDYLKASRSDAQDKAAESVTKLNELEARMPQLELAASGEATKRKAMHLKKVYDQQDKQIKNLRAELAIVKRTLQSKEDELTRLKSTGRMGVGTRGTSTTPQPKIRSRAGSPILGGRIGTLRSG
jgi:chromosome segregation ATPase